MIGTWAAYGGAWGGGRHGSAVYLSPSSPRGTSRRQRTASRRRWDGPDGYGGQEAAADPQRTAAPVGTL